MSLRTRSLQTENKKIKTPCKQLRKSETRNISRKTTLCSCFSSSESSEINSIDQNTVGNIILRKFLSN